MKGIIAYFLRYPIVGNTIMVLFFIFGYIGMKSLKSSFFPETESRFISVDVVYPGASPEEVEEGVILKIEEALKGLTGIERITSVSNENRGSVSVEVFKEFDTDLVLMDVKNNVDRISSFPVGIERPQVFKRETVNFAIAFAISGDVDLKTLKTVGRRVEDELRSKEFITKVEVTGFPTEEIEIAVNETVMRRYMLTFEQVVAAVRAGNSDVTGGTIKTNSEELLIRAKNKEYYVPGLLDIIVKTNTDGSVIRLKDIASITDTWADAPSREFVNGEPAVNVLINNTVTQDILTITDYVKKEYLPEIQSRYPHLKFTIIRDGSKTLQDRIDLLVSNGQTGFLLVLVFLALFLNVRLAFWVAMGIPVAFMGMFIIASFFGLSINVVSLFGMILVVGILVDDGIVISENVFRHYQMGKSGYQAAIDGSLEVLPAVFTAVITTLISFGSIFFLDGRIGDIFPDMAFVVVVTLIVSLVEAVLILPAHVSHSSALKSDHNPSKIEKAWNWLTEKLEYHLFNFRDKFYVPTLKAAIHHKALTVSICIFLLLSSFGLLGGGYVKFTFFPFIERDDLDITLELPAGTREHITKNYLEQLADDAWKVNDLLKPKNNNKDVIEKIRLVVGPQSYAGKLVISLTSAEERAILSNQIANELRLNSRPIPDAENLSFSVSSIFGKPVSVALLSNNLELLESARDEFKEALSKNPDVKDVVDNQKVGLRELNIQLKPLAYNLGLNENTILAQVRSAFFGQEIQRLQRGRDEVKIWVRYDLDARHSISQLEEMRIRVANNEYPLKELVTLTQNRGVIAINHLDGSREVRVEADLANPKVSSKEVNDYIENVILPPILAQHPGVRYSFEGQVRENLKTQKSMGTVLPLALLMMFSLVVVTFRSVWQTFAVFILVLVFGSIGVIWGHWFHGHQLSLFSILGVIALIGVMINDSLVMVAAMNQYIKEGLSFEDALIEAGKTRFRPILLTSVTTIAGLGPLIFETSFQAQFLIPMAISLAYGLATATLFTLILLPTFLMFINKARVYLTWLWEGKKPTPESVEPAFKEANEEHTE